MECYNGRSVGQIVWYYMSVNAEMKNKFCVYRTDQSNEYARGRLKFCFFFCTHFDLSNYVCWLRNQNFSFVFAYTYFGGLFCIRKICILFLRIHKDYSEAQTYRNTCSQIILGNRLSLHW